MEMKNTKSEITIKNGFEDQTQEFINKKFNTRTCYKYKEKSKDICHCNRHLNHHTNKSNSPEEWSYSNNTTLDSCVKFGRIKFSGYPNLPHEHWPKFIRFDCEEDCDATCRLVYELMTNSSYWNIPDPTMIISINGGLKNMESISNHHKKKFKQGLIDVIKKAPTWVIGSGLSAGIHKLVSEAIYEFRLHHEDMKDQVTLIGISTWGTIKNNHQLDKTKTDLQFEYEYSSYAEKGKVTLDALYDTFLFCDDGTEKQYDKDEVFRLKFENLVKEKGFLVQILFEGGRRALVNAYKAIQNKVPLVVIKGSGRVANMISEVMELPKKKYKNKIEFIVSENRHTLQISTGPREAKELEDFTTYLSEMYCNFKKQIVIDDMMDLSEKFDKKILQAMIIGVDESLEKTLDLCIRFNCSNVAEKFVFSDPKYGEQLDPKTIEEMFKRSLKDDKPEFVNLFVENYFEVNKLITEDLLIQLYEISFDSEKCLCAELLVELACKTKRLYILKQRNNEKKQNRLFDAGRIIAKLSGNLLNNRYLDKDNIYTSHDLFLWALLSGRTDLSLILWRIGKNHISSALVAAIILKKMTDLVLIRNDNNLQRKLTDASKKYQDLASSIITQAYNKSKSKTYTLLVRSLARWNGLTCLQLAVNGNMLEFLNHSACRSYTSKVWMGDLPPFLPIWKIIITIPFSLFLMKLMIMPSFPRKRKCTNVKTDAKSLPNTKSLTENEEVQISNKQKPITFRKAMKVFYRATIVKFYIYLLSYVSLLFVFTYLNLVEMKPLEDVANFKNNLAEIYVYLYVFTFICEEIRQAADQKITGVLNKAKEYFSGIWNKIDVFIISLFFLSVILRFSIPKTNFMSCRCCFAVTLSMFFIRAMQFYFINQSIGPKVIMIREMLRDILFFLSIFIIFLLAYGTLFQSLKFPNSKFDLNLFKDIVYLPYFQTFGELMLEIFDSGTCNRTDCVIRNATVIFSFAIYLLMAHILLVNLLIAMFGYTFQQIHEDSEKLWCFIRVMLVQEFYEKNILPPPLNIFYCIIRLFNYLLPNHFKRNLKKKNNILFHSLSVEENQNMHRRNFKTKNNLLFRSLEDEENQKMSGFEQLCMEAVMLELSSQVTDIPPIMETKTAMDTFDTVDAAAPSPIMDKKYEFIASKLEKILDCIKGNTIRNEIEHVEHLI